MNCVGVVTLPPGVVSVTVTAPVPAGERAVTSVELITSRLVAAFGPNVMLDVPPRFVPVIVTAVPPAFGPALGTRPLVVEIVGGGT